MTKDKYDLAIEYLESLDDKEYVYRTKTAWGAPHYYSFGCLFQFCAPDGLDNETYTCDYSHCGCLTQICTNPNTYSAFTESLKNDIRMIPEFNIDPRNETIPKTSLKIFADWQRKMDQIWAERHKMWEKAREQMIE